MKTCLNCKATENETPLLDLNYQGEKIYICPRCLPQLIHKPANLVGTLQGAENIQPADEL